MGPLVRCVKCDEVFLRTPHDQAPEYEGDLTGRGKAVRTVEKDDYGDFLKDHDGHWLEDLTILEDSFASEKDFSEPVKVSYFKATNGKERFVVKRYRDRVGDPLKYELIHGDYSLVCLSVDIQSQEIAKQLGIALKERGSVAPKIHAFLKLFQRLAQQVDVTRLERVPEESDNPLVVYYRLDEVSLIFLLRNCRPLFDPEEFPEVEAFIYRHKEDGVLLLKARYQIRIEEEATSEEETPAVVFGLDQTPLAEKA